MAIETQASVHCIEYVLNSEVSTVRGSTVLSYVIVSSAGAYTAHISNKQKCVDVA